jgi:hypothetical protein
LKLVADLGLEVVLHQPFLHQVRLGQGAPELFGGMRDLAFDDDGARRSRCWSLVHPVEQVFEIVEPGLPEPGHAACPVDHGARAFSWAL